MVEALVLVVSTLINQQIDQFYGCRVEDERTRRAAWNVGALIEVKPLSRNAVVIIQMRAGTKVEKLDDGHIEADVERRGPVHGSDLLHSTTTGATTETRSHEDYHDHQEQ